MFVYGLLWHDILINSEPKKKNETSTHNTRINGRTNETERASKQQQKNENTKCSLSLFIVVINTHQEKKTMKFIIRARANKEPTEMNEHKRKI